MGSSTNPLSAITPSTAFNSIMTRGKDLDGNKRARNARNLLDPGNVFTGAYHTQKEAEKEARTAAEIEAERQRKIQEGIAGVNSVFDSPERKAQYDDFAKALRENYTKDATRQKGVADRQMKFSLARGGLTGGSADADARRAAGEEFSRGILTAENKAQDAVADLRGADEQSRMNLIQLVTSGLDATTAAQRANAVMQSNAAGRQAQGFTEGLGDIFGNTAATYKRQQEAAAFRRGQLAPVGSLYGLPGGR